MPQPRVSVPKLMEKEMEVFSRVEHIAYRTYAGKAGGRKR